jgi:peptidoglycan/LPS O-acetylase OafA/YrhL
VIPLAVARRVLVLALVLTLLTASAFIVAIAGGLENGVGTHEFAGSALLTLLLVALAFALRVRTVDSRPLGRVCVALVALVAAGVLGASLATGFLPSGASGVPLVPLLVLVGSTADAFRISWSLQTEPPRE